MAEAQEEADEEAAQYYAARGNMLLRPLGRRCAGLRTHKPLDSDFAKLTNYRTYRLLPTPPATARESLGKTRRSHKYLKQAGVAVFSGGDPLALFPFLATFVVSAERCELGEMEAVELLPDFLTGGAESSYQIAKGTVNASGAAFTWPYAIQHLLTTYATDDNLREGVDALLNIRQTAKETESELLDRIHKAHSRLGHYLDEARLITYYVRALADPIRPTVSAYRDDNRRASLADIARKAVAVGTALRAQGFGRRHGASVSFADTVSAPGRRTGEVSLLHKARDDRDSISPDTSRDDSASSFTLDDAYELIQDHTANLAHSVLNMTSNGGGGFSTRKAPRFGAPPYEYPDAPAVPRTTPPQRRRICWRCYSQDH